MGNSTCCEDEGRGDTWKHVQMLDPLQEDTEDISKLAEYNQGKPPSGELCSLPEEDFTELAEARPTDSAAAAPERLPTRSKTFANGVKYLGEWSDTNRHGHGVQHWPDGSVYDGQWAADKAAGVGTFTGVDGGTYRGQWVDDQAHGRGVYLHTDGSSYDGLWEADKKHGEGTESYTDGTNYGGQFVEGLKQGEGVFSKADGSSYRGSFHEDCLHGRGQYSWADGRSYEGQYFWNRMHGAGTFVGAPDSAGGAVYSYTGHFRDNLKDGYGRLTWPDGSVFEGQWAQGKQHGLGTMSKPGDEKKYGRYEHGHLSEPGFWTYEEDEDQDSGRPPGSEQAQAQLSDMRRIANSTTPLKTQQFVLKNASEGVPKNALVKNCCSMGAGEEKICGITPRKVPSEESPRAGDDAVPSSYSFGA